MVTELPVVLPVAPAMDGHEREGGGHRGGGGGTEDELLHDFLLRIAEGVGDDECGP